ncbi:MAG: enoyl-ACP reductase FabI [Thermoleophilia bacterium]|nr:enoyl-ACP reductase FabI [Thermoleophilia bacterium]
MGILDGKRLLITGVLTPQSLAFHVATAAQAAGAELVLSSFGRMRSLTERTANRLEKPVEVVELDVNDEDHLAALAGAVKSSLGGLDGALHAIAFAPEDALGGKFLSAPRDSAELAFRTSAYSYKALAAALLPLLERDRSDGPGTGETPPPLESAIVGLDFDATVAWPIYDWMGVAKAALESVNRYLARDLGPHGIRANLVSAGPLRTMAAKGIPGFKDLAEMWPAQAPLGWSIEDPRPVANTVCFLLSDLSRGISGEIIHVDGGFHAIGAPSPA